mgnify:CR=1 FL=1|tara:strand:+ start:5782 stop:6804 length:1023 start_codon:yes stop_codon:yes gene_type:complete
MKEIKNKNQKSILKKIFIKICRYLGYEIIDQNAFEIPTLNKSLNEEISTIGKKSINLPLGEIKITRKVKALDIIIRTCTEINMLTQNKKRIFEKDKIEYTLRSINSILRSLESSNQLRELKVKFKVIDHNSRKENLDKIDNLFKNSNMKYDLINLDVSKFEKNIKKTNQKNQIVTQNQMSNMANIYQSLIEAKESEDLIYFVEDDYIHTKDSLNEMVLTYERIASQINNDLIICPADYPYLYTKGEMTQIFLGNNYHWRKIDETLCTFLTSKKIINRHWETFKNMCEFEHYPFEKPLHDIYKKELCLSPIPSLAIHCTNVNSIFGLSPNLDWKKVWDENK